MAGRSADAFEENVLSRFAWVSPSPMTACGHGRSSQPWIGNMARTRTISRRWSKRRPEECNPRQPPGGGEVARYIGNHGTKGVKAF
jgi:hypothetical protein